ncbi:MAG: Sjogren's syndrome/scleroderma autoantigen 1 family protein [Candidatus Heimdallarchaeaceae archaeon]
MNSDSEDYVKAGADILLRGGKMLNKACPTCISPLYEINGKVVCVKCKQEYVLVSSKAELQAQQQRFELQTQSIPHQPNKEGKKTTEATNTAFTETARIIQQKISQLNRELQQTMDVQKIKEITDTIKTLVETLKILE